MSGECFNSISIPTWTLLRFCVQRGLSVCGDRTKEEGRGRKIIVIYEEEGRNQQAAPVLVHMVPVGSCQR